MLLTIKKYSKCLCGIIHDSDSPAWESIFDALASSEIEYQTLVLCVPTECPLRQVNFIKLRKLVRVTTKDYTYKLNVLYNDNPLPLT